MSMINPGDWAVSAIDKQLSRLHQHAKEKHFQALEMQKHTEKSQLNKKPKTLKKSDFATKYNTTLHEEPQMDAPRTTQVDPSAVTTPANSKVPVKRMGPKPTAPGTKPKKK